MDTKGYMFLSTKIKRSVTWWGAKKSNRSIQEEGYCEFLLGLGMVIILPCF